MKKLAIIMIISVSLVSCAEYMKVFTPETAEQRQRRIDYKLEKQLDHERLVRECYQCDCCKGRYKVYNRSYKKK